MKLMYYRLLGIAMVWMGMACVAAGNATNAQVCISLSDSDYDWIQLTSGECLKGDFKVLYYDVVEFDSEELGLQEFDFEDVAQLRTRDTQMIRLNQEGWKLHDEHYERGMLVVDNDAIRLVNGEQVLAYSRDEVVSIATGVERERDFWSGNISVGATAREGNTKTLDITTMINLKRRKASSRFLADYIENYSGTDGTRTAHNQRLNSSYDWFLTKRIFLRTVAAQYYRDPFLNIGHQYSLGSALGYELLNTSRVEWNILAGGGYQRQHFVSVLPPEDKVEETPFFLGATSFELEVTDDVDFSSEYSFRLLNRVLGTYTHHAVTKLSTEFIGDLDVAVSLIWDYIERPRPTSTGTIPEQSDFQLVFSAGYTF